ncbi:LutC/YkgG family protein [Thermaerobacillus caldiproteolyticus]|uniref:Lactate utilization protein C n=1 Tax=Thermaerobacillus caldiproteolyticus TaxID=247480 RepID=A0A7V9Z9T3_9BACL|nr:lactate utilization protein C [Anoxybacillus caldiproteolyticus]MBA2876628.1 L-lactate dehydrogenase complex protein LldG [Anoxybacillus caldiproteolyticus]QPA31315.1 lactate utilization protein C [Anoxybacillus caldiproteolyticus]
MSKGAIHGREKFLQTIANRLGRQQPLSHVARPRWKHQPQWTVFQGRSQDDLLEALKSQCSRIHTDYIETTIDALSSTLKNVVFHHGGGPVVTWDDPRFHEYGLTHLLQKEWPNENVDVHVWNASIGRKNIEFAEKANVGITFSDMTLAESGTVVVLSGNGKGRTVSFLPKTYIAIIAKSTIVPRMTQAAAHIHQQIEKGTIIPSCINFITGPSNSADIEMNLVVGVHGPVKVTYIIVTDR